jgi:hypothetical protein
MFLFSKDGVFDFDLDLLVELLEVVDHQILRIEDEISRSPDPDSFGHFDRMEGVIGLGFVACQQYINATYPQIWGKNKSEAIQAPPKHSSGQSVTEVINAAANFLKHHDEWPVGTDKKQTNKREEQIRVLLRDVINSPDPSSADYVMGNVLHALLQPQAPRFASVVHLLTQWRDRRIEQKRSSHSAD